MTEPVQGVSAASGSTPVPASTPAHEAVTLETYFKRDDPNTPIRGLVYPVVSAATPTDEVEDLLEVVRTELSAARDELTDVTDQRRKIRDLAVTGLAAVVAAFLLLFKAPSHRWEDQVPNWVGYVLVVLLQIGIPLKLFGGVSKNERSIQAQIKNLEKVRLEYESALRREKRNEDTSTTIQDDDE